MLASFDDALYQYRVIVQNALEKSPRQNPLPLPRKFPDKFPPTPKITSICGMLLGPLLIGHCVGAAASAHKQAKPAVARPARPDFFRNPTCSSSGARRGALPWGFTPAAKASGAAAVKIEKNILRESSMMEAWRVWQPVDLCCPTLYSCVVRGLLLTDTGEESRIRVPPSADKIYVVVRKSSSKLYYLLSSPNEISRSGRRFGTNSQNSSFISLKR